jgi:hypothetical protein
MEKTLVQSLGAIVDQQTMMSTQRINSTPARGRKDAEAVTRMRI